MSGPEHLHPQGSLSLGRGTISAGPSGYSLENQTRFITDIVLPGPGNGEFVQLATDFHRFSANYCLSKPYFAWFLFQGMTNLFRILLNIPFLLLFAR